MFDDLHKVIPSASIFTQFPLIYFYDRSFQSCTATEMKEIATKDEASFLERSTREQSPTCLWYAHQVGCITASYIGQILKYSGKHYPTSIVKTIMQYTTSSPNIPALKWGRCNEDTARKQYTNIMTPDHDKLHYIIYNYIHIYNYI